MAVKVAINGFGRIGRLAFRQMFAHEGSEVVAINDLTSPDMLAYLLKYDTVHGNYARDHEVSAGEDSITVDGKTIKIYKEPDASKLPWGKLGVDVVLECTGFYTSKAKAMAHINAGAKKVVISAPAGKDLKTIVYNVNHETLTAEDDIISAASCTTNCLAPMAKALNDAYPIKSGIMQTIHAFTGDQMALDGPQRKGNFRRSRTSSANIVPTSSGAAKAIGLVLPELDGKLIGAAQRVPVPDGSTTLLYAVVTSKDPVSVDSINAAMKAASDPETFGYNDEQIVSSDIIGMTYGSLFDATQTAVLPVSGDEYLVQVVSWYDNENSYTSQMVRTIKYFEKFVA
ncbi:MAG: type I glyceraldehyde-3-phosphate dehydrogenase [Coriobacteriaceae bacterium]|jgi:glyceraldehyde 3-phosphate dehydrogenase|uniref:type I glyceraldehyde-3-phosphate dehydrogenase n=1 Tax=Atopobium sp. oral taxon 416 TaxID=712157 RepID=UPI000FF4DAE9|nr:type I glyceraldehyde-3-phosphate dehydrogenase [Atopobium sp. oral taxon 416]QUC02684.1 type I glyceraldehyde-3-phosphate dehydrogenase [Atopobium sp. oral taxon 416]RRG00062.1 MAG: type I glyceraldehyde-3-phosphate dehydrogenase [Coriobacteriaceae bacterium]